MTWTIHKAAIEFGVEPKSLAKWLSESGHQLAKGKTFTTLQICEAIYDDLKKARAREATANAVAKERDNLEKAGDLLPTAEVHKMIREAHMPVRQRLLALPSEMANRCNPTDATLARDALQRWSDDTLATIRGQLPQGKGGG